MAGEVLRLLKENIDLSAKAHQAELELKREKLLSENLRCQVNTLQESISKLSASAYDGYNVEEDDFIEEFETFTYTLSFNVQKLLDDAGVDLVEELEAYLAETRNRNNPSTD